MARLAKRRVRSPLAGFRFDARRGIVHITVCVKGTSGKTRRKRTVAVTDRDHAVEEWRKFRAELGMRGGRATVWTLRTYVAAHRKHLVATLVPAAAKSFDLDIRRLFAALGEKPLGKITDADVRDLAIEMRLAAPTVNHALATLRKVLNDAVSRREIAAYPIARRLPTRKVDPLRLELSDEERLAFLAAFDDEAGFRQMLSEERVVRIEDGKPYNAIPIPDGEAAHVRWAMFRASRPVFVVALETGLSRSDLLALTWADVAGDTIVIPRLKTGVVAVAPITTACRAALDEVKGRAVTHRTRVFLGPFGRPLCASTLIEHFDIAKRLAGITRRFRFHDIRHTLGCRLATAGVPLQVIARTLGHASIKTTERYARPGAGTVDLVRAALETAPATAPATQRPRGIRNA